MSGNKLNIDIQRQFFWHPLKKSKGYQETHGKIQMPSPLNIEKSGQMFICAGSSSMMHYAECSWSYGVAVHMSRYMLACTLRQGRDFVMMMHTD